MHAQVPTCQTNLFLENKLNIKLLTFRPPLTDYCCRTTTCYIIVFFLFVLRYNEYGVVHYPSPKYGINSGVILMDLERMRRVKFTEKILEIYKVCTDEYEC